MLESFPPSEASPEEITKAIYEVISEKGWGDGETGPQIPKKCMGEAIKLVKAKFTHAIAGTLYYRITTDNIVVEFPIDMNDKDDVGTTTFVASYKPITLMRYIRKAMENETLITIDKSKLK